MMKKIFILLIFIGGSIYIILGQTGSSPGVQKGSAGLGSMLILFLPLILIWYFLLIKPQQKKEKERQAMIQNLKKGDEVLTIGGIYGEVTQIKDNRIILKIADKVNIEVAKSAISSKVTK